MRNRIFALLCLLFLFCPVVAAHAYYHIDADEVIEVSKAEDMQSQHPYESNTNTLWVYTHPQDVTYLEVTFSEETFTESGCDYISIYDENYDSIAMFCYGDELAGQTVIVPGSGVAIRLDTDSSVNKYGFAVTSIVGRKETGPITTLGLKNITKDSLTLTFPPVFGAASIEAQISTDGINWESAQLDCDIWEDDTSANVISLKAETMYYFRLNVKGGDREGISNVVSTYTKGYYTVENGSVVYYDGEETEVVIPSVIEGQRITAIGGSAFCYSELVSVVIPEGVVSIGSGAFAACEKLEAVTLPATITSIADDAFRNCTSLKEITIPEGVGTVEEDTFFNCYSLEGVTLPATITSIADDAFRNCTSLKEIIIPDGVVSVGENAFKGCSSLAKITLGTNVGQIGENAFSSCPSIEQINWNCKMADTSYKKIFKDSGSKENGVSVKLGDSVEEIPHYAFANQDGNGIGAYITELDLGNSVKKVGWNSFQNCVLIKELTIPESLTSIWEYAFNGLESLENLYINSNIQSVYSYSYGIFKGAGSASPSGLTVHFGDTVTQTGTYIFKNCVDITQVVMSDSLITIGEGTFLDCSGLSCVSGGAGVGSIGKRSFDSCSLLDNINGMKNVKTIGEQAFVNCTSLTTISCSKVTSIETKAFSGCSNLRKITLGKNLTTLGDYAFSECTGLETVHISAHLPDLTSKSNVFYLCGTQSDGIKVVFAENISTVPAYLFAGDRSSGLYPNVVSVHLGSNVTSIGKNAFYWNRGLIEITGGSSLKAIGESAFSYCDTLVSVAYLPNLETIEASAFFNCNALSNFRFSDTVRKIGGSSFGYTALKEIIIPEGVELIGSWAFEWCDSAEVISVPSTASFVSGGFAAFSSCNSLKTLYWNTNNTGKVEFKAESGVETEGFELIIGDGVDTVNSKLFSYSDVRKVIIGAGTTTIGAKAFESCAKLKEVVLSSSVEYICEYAFCYSSIEKINLDNVLVIGYSAFNDCTGITDINLSGAIKIDENAFYGFAGESVYAPEARYIGQRAFCNSPNLKNVNLPKAEYIGYEAFRDCSLLEMVTFSRSLSYLGNYAFSNCALKSAIVYSDSVRNTSAFYGNPEGFILNYYSEDFNDIVLEDRLDSYEGLVGQTVKPEEITITGPDKAAPGDIFALNKEYKPKSATDTITSWTSSKPEVATVSNGIVTCHDIGNTVICAMTSNGTEAFHWLTVTEADLEILCDKSPLAAGLEKTLTVYATFESKTYAPELARWESDDDDVIAIESTGYTYVSDGKYNLYAVIKGVGVGLTDIRVIVNEIYSEVPAQVGIHPDQMCTFVVVDNKRMPIEGATVKIGEYEITTDANGEAAFVKSLFSGKVFVEVHAGCDGYAARTTRIPVYENAPTYIALEKVKDEPFFTDIIIRVGQDGNAHSRNLMDPNTSLVYVGGKRYNTPSTITAFAYWGDNAQGRINLVSERTGDSFGLTNNTITFNPSAEFRVGDTFRLEATALSPDGAIVKTVYKLPIRIIEYNDKIFPYMDGSLDLSKLPGFDDVVFVPNFSLFGSELEFDDDDGVFSMKLPVIKKEIPIFKTGKDLEITLKSDIKYPLLNPINPSFTGGISLGAEVEDIIDKSLGNTVVMVGYTPVPLTGNLTIGAGIDSSVEISGLFNDPRYHGEISPKVEFDIRGGVGASTDEVGICSGVFISAEPNLTFEFDNSWTPVFNPSIEINFGCCMDGKLFSLESSYSYNILNVTYEDGEWSGKLFDSSVDIEIDGSFIQPAYDTAQISEWTLVDRSYVSENTGFCANDAIKLFDIETSNRNETLIYDDIISSSEALLGYINGKKTLIYTYDDSQREIQNALKLVYTVQGDDGVWSEPQSVCDDLTADSAPAGDKNYVIWENVSSVLGEDTDIAEYLGKTEISVSRFNEDMSVDTWCLTQNSIYDSAPDISVFDGGALAVWVSNDANDIVRLTGTNTLMYSLFDGNIWSEPQTVCTVSQIGAVRAEASGDKKYIFYADGDTLKSYCINTNVHEVICGDAVRFATDTDDTTAVLYFDSANNLMYTDDFENTQPSRIDTRESGVNFASAPQIVSRGGETYVVWRSRKNGHDTLEGVRSENGSWTDIITFASGDKDVLNPALVINEDNTFSMVYYSRIVDIHSSGISNVRDCALYVCDITPSYNLALYDVVDYDAESFRQSGIVEFTAEISNIGELNADGFEISVSDGDNVIASFTEDAVLKAGAKRQFTGAFEHKGTKDKGRVYQIRVIPCGVTDFDISDNTAELAVGINDIAVESAYFTTEFDKTYINIIVANEGTNELDGAIVRVNAQDISGKEICTLPTGVLGFDETKILRFDVTNESTRQFFVSAFALDDANRYNDSAIAYRTAGLNDGDISEKTELITNSVPVNGDEVAVTQLGAEDIASLGFDITNPGAAFEAVISVVYISDGKGCGFVTDSFLVQDGTSNVHFENVRLPAQTDALRILIWNKQNLKPLISPKEYNLSVN